MNQLGSAKTKADLKKCLLGHRRIYKRYKRFLGLVSLGPTPPQCGYKYLRHSVFYDFSR
jgi:hypothetical protein